MSDAALDLVRRFALALDAEDYDGAAACLDPGCTYTFRERTVSGAEAIIASYRGAGDWARASFDEISYESDVAPVGDGTFRIAFADLTQHGGRRHRHECAQVVTVCDGGRGARIIAVRHIDLPGERERLDAFLEWCGVTRPA